MARHRRRENGVNLKSLTRWQHGFDTAAHTQTDAPGAAPGRGRSLASTIARGLQVVVMFVNEDNCRQLINATIANHLTDAFYFVASDSWGAKRVPVDKQEWAAEGTVTILPQRQVVRGLSLHIT